MPSSCLGSAGSWISAAQISIQAEIEQVIERQQVVIAQRQVALKLASAFAAAAESA